MPTKKLLKIVLSFAMLALVLANVEFSELTHTLSSISPLVYITVILGYALGQALSAFKWMQIVRAGGIATDYISTLKAYYIGTFVNCFGLGILGGDIARGILISDGEKSRAASLSSVVADRAHGLATLAFLGALTASIFGAKAIDEHLVSILTGLGFAIAAGWFIGPALVRRFVPTSFKFRKPLLDAAEMFPKDPITVFKITVISVIFHLVQILLHAVMAYGVGASIPWPVLLVIIPFVNILSSLPISWNGLGVRENTLVFFLVPAYLTNSQAVAFGAMWLIGVTVTSAIGGIVAVLTKDFEVLRRRTAANVAV